MGLFDKIFGKDNSDTKADKQDCCHITFEEVKETNETCCTQK
ncbi:MULTISPECIES: hypothetical protein [Bacillus]|nr:MULTISPECIES: hypothetical protein [Bacillus]WFA05906.1 hypothetical protein P3X63_03550 [Bacillus sp. HSf4]